MVVEASEVDQHFKLFPVNYLHWAGSPKNVLQAEVLLRHTEVGA